jgi:hypothetical protein
MNIAIDALALLDLAILAYTAFRFWGGRRP